MLAHMPFGDAVIPEGAAMAGRPPLDLRVNTLKSDRAHVLKALNRFGAEPAETAAAPVRLAA